MKKKNTWSNANTWANAWSRHSKYSGEVKFNDARKRLKQILNNTKNKTHHVDDNEFNSILRMLESKDSDDIKLARTIIITNSIFKEEYIILLLCEPYISIILLNMKLI